MGRFWRPLQSFSKRSVEILIDLTGYGGTIAIILSMAIIVYEVFARYVFRWATVWEIETAVFLIVFMTFVGSAFALKNDAHIRMDVFTGRLGPKGQKMLSVLTSLMAFAFCVIATVKGGQMWWEAYRLGWRSDSLWAPPLAIPYAFLPLGFFCLCLQYIVMILREIKSLTAKNSHGH